MAKDCPEPQKEKKGKKGKRGQNGGQRQGNNSGNSSQNNRSNSSRNARSGGHSEEQFIPEGLRDLYRSDGKTFSAHIEDQQLQDLMRWYDKMIQKADTAASSPELQGTDCPELRLQATESTVLQATERPEVTETNCAGVKTVDGADSFIGIEPQVTERTEPQVADCPEATGSTVAGSAMLLHVHSSMEDDRDKLLWDSGANVNITNSIGDFERDSILDIRSKGIHIMTGGGPVAATSIGTVKWPLRGPHGENNEVTVKYTLHISDFPLKVFSGEIFYRRGGYLDRNTLGYELGGPFGEKDGGDLANDLRDALVRASRHGRVFMTDEVMKKIILWHRRLCHPSTERLIWTIKRSTGIDLDPAMRATYVGEIIWCDVGAVKPVSIENNGYFGLITDDLSRYREYYSFRTKDEVQESLCTYITRIIKRLETLPTDTEGRKRMVQILRLDGGKEFGVTKIENFCAVEGIELVISSTHNHADEDTNMLLGPCDGGYNAHRLRHRQKQQGVGVKNKDHNVVSGDDTDQETKQIKRKRGRPKKTVPELYALEAPDEAPELMRELKLALTQEGDDLDGCDPYPYPFHFHPLLTDADDEDGYRLGHGHLVGAKWVLKKKYTSTGKLEKYKARICAREFTQRKGIDYNETAASTARAVHWRILMALTTALGWYILQIDFIAAYLNGHLKEDIYIKQFPMLKKYFDTYPKDREAHRFCPKKVIKLMNPLYCLKQAGAACIANGIAEDVPIKDLGDANWYLGVRIVRSSPTGDVRLDQQQYIEKSLKSLGLDAMRKQPTPFVKDYLQHAVRYEGVASKEDTYLTNTLEMTTEGRQAYNQDFTAYTYKDRKYDTFRRSINDFTKWVLESVFPAIKETSLLPGKNIREWYASLGESAKKLDEWIIKWQEIMAQGQRYGVPETKTTIVWVNDLCIALAPIVGTWTTTFQMVKKAEIDNGTISY
ncbi:hypothetical protein DL765_009679 [Monosporascus sp. GIB2]|nr:hypothetical protein DL765_009679 [Monosporascus sp. GIB2]